MRRDYSEPLAVRVATEVLGMHRELVALREEVEELREYREKYLRMLDDGLADGKRMVGNLLELALVVTR